MRVIAIIILILPIYLFAQKNAPREVDLKAWNVNGLFGGAVGEEIKVGLIIEKGFSHKNDTKIGFHIRGGLVIESDIFTMMDLGVGLGASVSYGNKHRVEFGFESMYYFRDIVNDRKEPIFEFAPAFVGYRFHGRSFIGRLFITPLLYMRYQTRYQEIIMYRHTTWIGISLGSYL